jgi:hypothetical protein
VAIEFDWVWVWGEEMGDGGRRWNKSLKSEAIFILAKILSWLLASPCCKVTVKLWVMMSRNMTKYGTLMTSLRSPPVCFAK